MEDWADDSTFRLPYSALRERGFKEELVELLGEDCGPKKREREREGEREREREIVRESSLELVELFGEDWSDGPAGPRTSASTERGGGSRGVRVLGLVPPLSEAGLGGREGLGLVRRPVLGPFTFPGARLERGAKGAEEGARGVGRG